MSASVSIFRATPAHLEHARSAMLVLHEREAADDTALRAFLEDETCYLMLAVVAKSQVVGSLIGYRVRNPPSHTPQLLLYEIDVLANARNGGIGRRLIAAFAESARAAGACEIWVVTNRGNGAALAMYAAAGFVAVNDDDQMLELRLTP